MNGERKMYGINTSTWEDFDNYGFDSNTLDFYKADSEDDWGPVSFNLVSGEYIDEIVYTNLEQLLKKLSLKSRRLKRSAYEYKLKEENEPENQLCSIILEHNKLYITITDINNIGNYDGFILTYDKTKKIKYHLKANDRFLNTTNNKPFKEALKKAVSSMNANTKEKVIKKKSKAALRYEELLRIFDIQFSIQIDRGTAPYSKAIPMLESCLEYTHRLNLIFGKKNVRMNLIQLSNAKKSIGRYTENHRAVPFIGLSITALVEAEEKLTFMDTYYHEFGHMIDYEFFRLSTKEDRFKYSELMDKIRQDTRLLELLNKQLYTKCNSVDEYLKRQRKDKQTFSDYYTSKKELFARLFAQHFVLSSTLIQKEDIDVEDYRRFSALQDENITELLNYVLSVVSK